MYSIINFCDVEKFLAISKLEIKNGHKFGQLFLLEENVSFQFRCISLYLKKIYGNNYMDLPSEDKRFAHTTEIKMDSL